jgi:DNA polymerase delta subunit 3
LFAIDEVIRVARKEPVFMKEEQEESSEDAEAVQVDTSIAPKPKPKKRPEKKVVPVGRNGLKKKRVVKSRMTTDAKGYMGMVIFSALIYTDLYISSK